MPKGTERNAKVARETIRATAGEPMTIVLNQVKADKWEQHEHFVHEIFMSATEKADSAAFRHTRFLHPAKPNEDGTHTSVWVMDPSIEGADYDISSLLKRAYGEDQGEEYFQLWKDSLASPQVGYTLIQSAW